MKEIKKTILSFAFNLVLVVGIVTPISAETNNQSSKDKTEESGPTPRWWPGNPNPAPGSEAWLQNHLYLPAPSAKAKTCALQTLGGSVAGATTVTVGKWIANGVLTAASFGLWFGMQYIASYTYCVFT